MPIYLSASSIADYIKCPKRVFFRIHKPFPPILSREMVLGISMHHILERGWKTREKAYEILGEEKEKLKLTKKEHTDFSFMIDLFFLNFRGLLGDSDLIEYMFKLQLYDDVFLVGKMDRVSQGNVFDWKTGATAKNLQGDVQCIIYDYAFNKLFGRPPSSVCIGALKQGQLVPYSKNDLYTNELFDAIIPKMIKTIKSENYEKLGLFSHGCFRCQFREGCIGATNVVDSGNNTE